MSDFEVPEAIICSPFEEPTHYWRLEEGAEPEKRPGRRPAIYYIPLDEPSEQQKAERGYTAFRRYACKMATVSGKTTVMGMIAAWSILNKVHDRSHARYSDVVLVVCPNVTIRSRLASNGDLALRRGKESRRRSPGLDGFRVPSKAVKTVP